MKTIRMGTLAALAFAGAAGAQSQVQQQAPGEAEIGVEQKQPVGRYLTDGKGRSVYMFEADKKNLSNCYDACAEAWPPVLSLGSPKAVEGADPQLLSSIQRKDGSRQVTYNGWPLYYFVKDKQPGDIKGQDVMGFGAEWYLLTPQGQVAHAEGQQEQPEG